MAYRSLKIHCSSWALVLCAPLCFNACAMSAPTDDTGDGTPEQVARSAEQQLTIGQVARCPEPLMQANQICYDDDHDTLYIWSSNAGNTASTYAAAHFDPLGGGRAGQWYDVIHVTLDGVHRQYDSRTQPIGSIHYHGRGGDDTYTNAASVPVTADGGDGADTLTGGPGPDVIHGGSGNDTLRGGRGDDTIDGGDGLDTLHGDEGDDSLQGGGGNDKLYGDSGEDTLIGDDLAGPQGMDELHGGDGDDKLFGMGADDELYGEQGNDTIRGGDGADSLSGGDDDDHLYGELVVDLIGGGEGADTIYGGEDRDWIWGNGGRDTIYGGDGDDHVWGGDGPDSLFGGDGKDTLSGDDGDDELFGEEGSDRLYGNGGRNFLNGGSGWDQLRGGPNDDILYSGDEDSNDMSGGGGEDIMVLGDGLTASQIESLHDRIEAILAAVTGGSLNEYYRGVSVALSKGGQLVFAKSWGEQHPGVPLQDHNIHRIASLSKTLTGAAIMKLMQDQYFDMYLQRSVFGEDGLLGNRFGEAPFSNTLQDINLGHLLTHTTNAWSNSSDPQPNPNGEPRPMSDTVASPGVVNHQELIQTVVGCSWDILRPPSPLCGEGTWELPGVGSRFVYSNFGYELLGRIIESQTGQTYDQYIKSLAGKCGISEVHTAGDFWDSRNPLEVTPSRNTHFDASNRKPYSRADSEGGMMISAKDFVKFIDCMDDASEPVLTSRTVFDKWTDVSQYQGISSYMGGMGINHWNTSLTCAADGSDPNCTQDRIRRSRWTNNGALDGVRSTFSHFNYRYDSNDGRNQFTWALFESGIENGVSPVELYKKALIHHIVDGIDPAMMAGYPGLDDWLRNNGGAVTVQNRLNVN